MSRLCARSKRSAKDNVTINSNAEEMQEAQLDAPARASSTTGGIIVPTDPFGAAMIGLLIGLSAAEQDNSSPAEG